VVPKNWGTDGVVPAGGAERRAASDAGRSPAADEPEAEAVVMVAAGAAVVRVEAATLW
jgi:hypothetical protein